MNQDRSRVFIAMWCCDGFEVIADLTRWEKQTLLDNIAGKKPAQPPVNLYALTMRAQFNPQRNYEIWIITTTEDLDEDVMWDYAQANPQALVDMIRERGKCHFRNAKNTAPHIR